VSDTTNDNDIDALLRYLNAGSTADICGDYDRYHRALTALVAERNRLRLCLPPTAHTGILNGPGEGTWSAFALKVVEQRDNLRDELAGMRQQREREGTVKREAAKKLIEAVKTLVQAWGSDTPPEAIWGVNRIIDAMNLEYGGSIPHLEEEEPESEAMFAQLRELAGLNQGDEEEPDA
jgi:hypothetical protein